MGRRAIALAALVTLAGCGRSDVYRPKVVSPCAALGTSRPCQTICGMGIETCVGGFSNNCTAPRPFAPPATIDLEGTIRDFREAHPDFEKAAGDDRGLVQGKLGADGEPAYAHTGSTLTVSSPASFAQWYHDVPGVNLSSPLALTLNRTSQTPLVYSFADGDFFPIDGRLFGNEGHNHNFHFTLELHTEVEYRGGETLFFQGDDDLLVYVDGQLQIDLGGTHRAEAAQIALDQLGLTLGTVYPLDVFFAERHTTESSLRIETTHARFVQCPAG